MNDDDSEDESKGCSNNPMSNEKKMYKVYLQNILAEVKMLYEITRQEIDPQGRKIRNQLERVISTRKELRNAASLFRI